jgi:hypothetical protein
VFILRRGGDRYRSAHSQSSGRVNYVWRVCVIAER